MDRREALAKATVVTADVSAGLLDPSQSRSFLWTIKDAETFGGAIRQEGRGTDSGEINKAATGRRIIRAATENADDGYRAGVTMATVPYETKKIRLPWEVTEDVYHANIEGQQFEGSLTADMTRQFGLDLADLDINGDTAAGAGPDQAFLQINDGILKQIIAAGGSAHRVNGATINTGALAKGHMFAAAEAMPTKYLADIGSLRWLINPRQVWNWLEYRVDRVPTNAGDDILDGQSSDKRAPLGIPFWPVSAMPTDRMILVQPRNFVRVVSWDVRKRRVTGETDAELAVKDKRLYVFFVKTDIVIEEIDALVDVYGLV